MKKVITIGRQFGSGGHTIGEAVAKQLGIPFYDKEMLNHIAAETGLMIRTPEENYIIPTIQIVSGVPLKTIT